MTPGEIYQSGSAEQLLGIEATLDIGVSMRTEVLEHKLRDGRQARGNYCYWTFPHGKPAGVQEGSRLWVAHEGWWVGYFVIHDRFFGSAANEACFFSESFVKIRAGRRKPFMGFTRKVPTRQEVP